MIALGTAMLESWVLGGLDEWVASVAMTVCVAAVMSVSTDHHVYLYPRSWSMWLQLLPVSSNEKAVLCKGYHLPGITE